MSSYGCLLGSCDETQLSALAGTPHSVIFSNSSLVQAALEKGKHGRVAQNFAYKTLLPNNIPQFTNI